MLMEWEKQEEEEGLMVINENNNNNNGNYGMFVKVMTDEQLEILRKQIAIYASICEQLVELHKTLTSHQDVTGIRLGSLYCDPLLTSAGHKITGRQRWTPTPVQLQILERLFDQGIGTPSRQRIKDIATELSQHGQISDTNVYNWFQNRRARSKRKQHVGAPSNGESEVETEVESLNEKNTKPEEFESQHNPETSFGLHSVDSEANKMETTFPSNACTEPVVGMKQAPFYGNMLSNPRDNHLFGKMEVSGSYNPYFRAEDYNTTN